MPSLMASAAVLASTAVFDDRSMEDSIKNQIQVSDDCTLFIKHEGVKFVFECKSEPRLGGSQCHLDSCPGTFVMV